MSAHKVQNNKLTMELYLDRLGDFVRYTFSRVPDGWLFDLIERSIVSDKDAIDFFEYLRGRDQLSYPCSIGVYFEDLWEIAGEGKLSIDELQGHVNELSFWISQNETFKPRW